MWHPDVSGDFDSNINIFGWQLDKEQLSFAITCAIALIIMISITIVFTIWYYCFCKKDTGIDEQVAHAVATLKPAFSTVYVDPKTGKLIYTAHIVEMFPEREGSPEHWFFNTKEDEPEKTNTVPRSASVPPTNQHQSFDPCLREMKEFMSNDTFDMPDLHSNDNDTQDKSNPLPNTLPEISEFNPHQFTSSSILDDCHKLDGKSATLRTRSLPTQVRNKKRPFSTSDNISELYAKVNFSKKRKNRMRNDEAAIIAMSKSRSQFLNNKDTDILVDNEAVIVYDERTAL